MRTHPAILLTTALGFCPYLVGREERHRVGMPGICVGLLWLQLTWGHFYEFLGGSLSRTIQSPLFWLSALTAPQLHLSWDPTASLCWGCLIPGKKSFQKNPLASLHLKGLHLVQGNTKHCQEHSRTSLLCHQADSSRLIGFLPGTSQV